MQPALSPRYGLYGLRGTGRRALDSLMGLPAQVSGRLLGRNSWLGGKMLATEESTRGAIGAEKHSW